MLEARREGRGGRKKESGVQWKARRGSGGAEHVAFISLRDTPEGYTALHPSGVSLFGYYGK